MYFFDTFFSIDGTSFILIKYKIFFFTCQEYLKEEIKNIFYIEFGDKDDFIDYI